ncbi:Small ribosomal subunit protein mS45 [Nakaseomyces bracarensis]|uniref:Small ribosomal subunit protein mS45 n=1 Tax=Nakaseomyces bracarensis TaxID=273131 RepID=A0ABR4NNZ7_9SACH
MLRSSVGSGGVFNGSGYVFQQVRNISRRRLAYPFYPFKRLGRQHPKKHDTNLKAAMRQFLGPKNYKGEYVMNSYFSVPNNHVPNYIKPDLERGQALRDPNTGKRLVERYDGVLVEAPANRRLDNIPESRALQPFPSNPHCKTNYMVSNELKDQIYNDIVVNKLSTQQVSQNYGLKIPRVEAVLKLASIEKKWEKNNRIKPELKTMSETLYKMFPLFTPEIQHTRENLSEIPVPQKALSSRFLTIAESQPFGPIDAAEVLELEPAVKTLEKLSTIGEHSEGHVKKQKKTKKVVYAELRKGERSQLKFTHARVGEVGHRYGRVLRDNKKDRKIGFNELGQMIYI